MIDQATEEATLRVRAWLRETLLKKLAVVPVTGKPLRVTFEPKPRHAPAKAAKPRPRTRPARIRRPSNGRGYHWSRNEALTIEAIIAGWREGLTPEEIAAKHNCQRTTVNKRLVAARRDPEFRALETELRTCKCGRHKYHHRKHCSVCAARECSGESTHRPDITIEGILLLLRERLNLRQIAGRLGCERRLIERRVKAAAKHPEFGPVLRAMSTCAECGRPKYMHVPGAHCRRCAVRLGTVETREAA